MADNPAVQVGILRSVNNYNTQFTHEMDGYPTSKGSSYPLSALSTQEMASASITNTACFLLLASKQLQLCNFGTIQPGGQPQPIKVSTEYFKWMTTMCRGAVVGSSMECESGKPPPVSRIPQLPLLWQGV